MEIGTLLGLGFGGFTLLATALFLIWSFVWKGWALWIAARKGSKIWFVALLLINTLGILEILYIFVFSKQNANNKIFSKAQEVKAEKTTNTSEEPNL